jgi:hypothetical protein
VGGVRETPGIRGPLTGVFTVGPTISDRRHSIAETFKPVWSSFDVTSQSLDLVSRANSAPDQLFQFLSLPCQHEELDHFE